MIACVFIDKDVAIIFPKLSDDHIFCLLISANSNTQIEYPAMT